MAPLSCSCMSSLKSASRSITPFADHAATSERPAPTLRHVSGSLRRSLPRTFVFAALVVVLPATVAWTLRLLHAVTVWKAPVVALSLSLAAGFAGDGHWRTGGIRELPFVERLPWGLISHRHNRRRLAGAMKLLGLVAADDLACVPSLSVAERTRLMQRLAATMEAQDRYLDGHSRRVARTAAMIARELELSPEYVVKVRTAAAVHDIGKLAIPLEILNKPGPLTSAELAVIRCHADNSAAIVAALGDPELTAIVRHHHERYDGAGYPSGLVQDQIPLGARIIAVADTFDALTSDRPYRPAADVRRALTILVRSSGSQLGPDVVSAFLRCYAGKRAGRLFTLCLASRGRLIGRNAGPHLGRSPPGHQKSTGVLDRISH